MTDFFADRLVALPDNLGFAINPITILKSAGFVFAQLGKLPDGIGFFKQCQGFVRFMRRGAGVCALSQWPVDVRAGIGRSTGLVVWAAGPTPATSDGADRSGRVGHETSAR